MASLADFFDPEKRRRDQPGPLAIVDQMAQELAGTKAMPNVQANVDQAQEWAKGAARAISKTGLQVGRAVLGEQLVDEQGSQAARVVFGSEPVPSLSARYQGNVAPIEQAGLPKPAAQFLGANLLLAGVTADLSDAMIPGKGKVANEGLAAVGKGAVKLIPDAAQGLSKTAEKTIQKYLSRAYKVFDKQKPAQVVANIADGITEKTGLPREVVVSQAFFDKMARAHPEVDRSQLFEFVRTLNIPDEVYQLSDKERLNFFRDLESQMLNIVGTRMKGGQQVVTSILTSDKERYPANIKNTAEAVFKRDTGGALKPSSVMQSPPAGARPEGLSGVSDSAQNVADNRSDVNREDALRLLRRRITERDY